MANFLSRLANRAVGLAPVAKPVIPSVFSPASGLASSGHSYESGAEATLNPTERSTQSESTTVVHSSSPLRQQMPPDSFETSIRSQAAPEATLPTMNATLADRSSTFTDFSSARAERPLEIHSSLTKQVFAAQPAEPATGFAAVHESRSPEMNLDAQDRTSSPLLSAPAPRTPIESHPANSHNESPGSAPFRALVKSLSQSGLGDTSENDPPRTQRSLTEAEFDLSPATLTPIAGSLQRQAPVIRVTIGRIDVRAQFPSPAASSENKKRTRTAATPLNEYLKQRSEGKR